MIKDRVYRVVGEGARHSIAPQTLNPNDISKRVGCSKQYAHRLLKRMCDDGKLARIRVTYKAGHRDIYTYNGTIKQMLELLKWGADVPVAIQENGMWSLAREWGIKDV